MGATDFIDYADGADAEEAFSAAVDQALYEYGHGGYTGTIAEKHEYVVIQPEPTTSAAASALAEQLLEAADERIDDKWGPAGAIAIGADGVVKGWLFFGLASH